jgi:hypothetical protein
VIGKIREIFTGELDDEQTLAGVILVPDAWDIDAESGPVLPLSEKEKPLFVAMVSEAVKQSFES